MQIELDAAIHEQPAASIFFDDVLGRGPEVLAAETRRVRRRRQVARSEEQHGAELLLARAAGEREARPRAGDGAAVVEEFVLTVTQPPLIGILERPVGVVLVIVA